MSQRPNSPPATLSWGGSRMRRVLFHVRGIPIGSYPALLYVGLVCGFYVMYAVAPSLGMHRVSAAVATLILFAPAIAGARIWFVLDHWAIYRHDLRRIWRHSEGGMTLYGGLVFALALSPVVLAALGLRFAAFWDGATFTMLTGMIFARVGCLLNGCCSGRRSDRWVGLRLPDDTGRWERRYPVQLLELAAAVVLLSGSMALLAVGAPRGAIFAVALVGYAGARLAIDPLREPPPRIAAGRRVALAAFLACTTLASVVGWLATGR
jgi:phosphatidylglycerol:prolipoprotein diacylglycerol transferase